MKAVAKILKTARPIEIAGHGTLRPGTIWMGEKMLVSAEPMRVYATIGDRLYEYGIGDWFREADLQGVQKAAKGAEIWCTIAEIEMGVICELICPMYLIVGVSCAKAGVFVHQNFKEIDLAMKIAPQASSLLLYCRKKYPVLCETLAKGALKNVVLGLKSQVVTKEHIASFIVDLLKDVAKNPEEAIAHFAAVIAKVALTVLSSNFKGMVAQAAITAANRRSEDLLTAMKYNGYQVTLAQVKAISSEVAADPSAAMKLQELARVLNQLLPLLRKLQAEKEDGKEPAEGGAPE